MIFSHFIFF